MIDLKEMQDDLANTESDIVALSNIVGALDVFMARTGGEDRSGFRMDRFKYAGLLSQAERLKSKIQSSITDSTDKGTARAKVGNEATEVL